VGDALALRCGRQSVALQHIANRLIADLIPQIGQRPRNPVIAPVTVLLGHANDQSLDLSPDPRPTPAATGLRAIEFAGDKFAVPGQDGVPKVLMMLTDDGNEIRVMEKPRRGALR
jgi:hypothetical protein